MKEELELELDSKNLETIAVFSVPHESDSYIHMFLAKDISLLYLKLHEGKSIVELSKEDVLSHVNVTDFTKEVISLL
jgi:hypothetical protein